MSAIPAESPVRVACIQMEPKVGSIKANVAESVARIDAASAQGARPIVLPELANSGYMFESREEAFSLAEVIPHGPACEGWMATAKRHDAYIVAGSAERAIFIAAADRVGTERGQPFVGSSLICSRTGWPIAGPASKTEAETIMADLNLSEARRKRNWNDSTRSCAIAGPTSTARCSAPA